MKKILNIKINSFENCVAILRSSISTFISEINGITVDDIMDVKTSLSEAVTNSIEHAYDNEEGIIEIESRIENNDIIIIVKDYGKGIEDIDRAIEPMYTSKPELEHAGLGFTIMENFMDFVEIDSKVDEGTTIIMKKSIVNKKCA